MYPHPLFLGSIWGYQDYMLSLSSLTLLPMEIPKLHRWASCFSAWNHHCPRSLVQPTGGGPRPCIMWLSLPPWNHLPSLLKSNPNVWPCSLNCHITTSGTSGYGAVVHAGNTSPKTLASLSCLLLLQLPYPAHTSKTALNSQYQYSHTLLPDKTPWRQGPSHDTHPGVLGPGPAVDLPHTFVIPVPTVMTALCDSVHWVAIYSISHFYILMGETNKMKSEHNYKL